MYGLDNDLVEILKPDLESQTNFGLEQTFNIFKNIQKHISSSVVCQGHSIRGYSSTQYVLNLVLQRGITVDLRKQNWGHCDSSSSAGSSKLKIRTSLRHIR